MNSKTFSTPELTQQRSGLIPEVVLAAADTFHEMLAAYRNNLQPPAGGALREHIQRLLTKPVVQPPKVAREADFEWTEYERLMIAEALRRDEHIYNVALHLDSDSLLPAAAFELIRKALEGAGKVIAQHPEKAADRHQSGVIEAALSTSKSADWIRQALPRALCRRDAFPLMKSRNSKRSLAILLDILLESEAAAISAGIKSVRERVSRGSRTISTILTPAASPGGISHATENSLRVDATRIETVMNLVGELIIGKSMLQRTINEFEHSHSKDPLRGKFSDALAFQSRVLGELAKISDENPHGSCRPTFPPLSTYRARRGQTTE